MVILLARTAFSRIILLARTVSMRIILARTVGSGIIQNYTS